MISSHRRSPSVSGSAGLMDKRWVWRLLSARASMPLRTSPSVNTLTKSAWPGSPSSHAITALFGLRGGPPLTSVKVRVKIYPGRRASRQSDVFISRSKGFKGGVGYGFRGKTPDRSRDRLPGVRDIHGVYGLMCMGDYSGWKPSKKRFYGHRIDCSWNIRSYYWDAKAFFMGRGVSLLRD